MQVNEWWGETVVIIYTTILSSIIIQSIKVDILGWQSNDINEIHLNTFEEKKGTFLQMGDEQ